MKHSLICALLALPLLGAGRFVPYAENPIFCPEMPWEAGNMARMSVINDGGRLRAAYWAGPYFQHPGGAINIASSDDGYRWTRESELPVLGAGHGGEPEDAERPTLLKVGDEYRIYYQDRWSSICLATSDDGLHFKKYGVLIGYWWAETGWKGGWNSVGAYFDGTQWLLTAQGMQDHLFSSVNGKDCIDHVGEINSLRQGAGTYNGRSCFVPVSGTVDGQVRDFYGARAGDGGGTVIELYQALVTDPSFRHFAPDPRPLLTRSEVWRASPKLDMPRPDGLLDTSVVEFKGKVFIYFTIFDNTNHVHRLGVATFDGTMSELFKSLQS